MHDRNMQDVCNIKIQGCMSMGGAVNYRGCTSMTGGVNTRVGAIRQLK